MDERREYYTKRSKSEKDKCCVISLTCEISKTEQINKHSKQKQSRRYREQDRWLRGAVEKVTTR